MLRRILTALSFQIIFFYIIIPLYSGTDGRAQTVSGTLEKADRLGEEFQAQMPWSRRMPESGGFYDVPQPREYRSTPEHEVPQEESDYGYYQYPLCYDPYTGHYEYCHPRDSYNFRMRFDSPDFRFWWRSGRGCPAGHYFVPDLGCYRQ